MNFYNRVDTNEHNACEDSGMTQVDQPQVRDAFLRSPLGLLWCLLTTVAMLGWVGALGWAALRLVQWVLS